MPAGRRDRVLAAGVSAFISPAESQPLEIPAGGHALFLEAALDPAVRPDLLADQLARPSDDFDPAAAVRAGLRGLLR